MSGNYNISTYLQKEFQRCCAILAYDVICRGGDTVNGRKVSKDLDKKSQMSAMYDMVHGKPNDNDFIGFAEQLASGTGSMFQMFYDKIDFLPESVDNNNPSSTRIAETKVLKDVISRNTSKNFYAQKDITKRMIQSSTKKKNSALISGRTIYNQAIISRKNGVKALGYAKELFDEKTGHYASGKNFDDFLECILHNMWKDKHENKSIDVDSVDDDDDEGPLPEDEDAGPKENENNKPKENNSDDSLPLRPENWFFEGFMALVMWGPCNPVGCENGYKLTVYSHKEADWEKKPKGRKTLRKEALQKNRTNHENDFASKTSLGDRGMNIKEQNAVVHIALAALRREDEKKEVSITNMFLAMDGIRKDLKFDMEFLKMEEHGSDEYNKLLIEIKKKRQLLSTMNTDLNELQSGRDKRSNNEVIIQDFLDSIKKVKTRDAVSPTPTNMVVETNNQTTSIVSRGDISTELTKDTSTDNSTCL